MARLKGRVDRLRRRQRGVDARGCPVCRGVGRLNVLIHGSGEEPTPCAGCGKYRCAWIVPVDQNGAPIGAAGGEVA